MDDFSLTDTFRDIANAAKVGADVYGSIFKSNVGNPYMPAPVAAPAQSSVPVTTSPTSLSIPNSLSMPVVLLGFGIMALFFVLIARR